MENHLNEACLRGLLGLGRSRIIPTLLACDIATLSEEKDPVVPARTFRCKTLSRNQPKICPAFRFGGFSLSHTDTLGANALASAFRSPVRTVRSFFRRLLGRATPGTRLSASERSASDLFRSPRFSIARARPKWNVEPVGAFPPLRGTREGGQERRKDR
eukprot:scaffold184_cov316-Pinguiococcus_pyrenoidosus.AAC.22